MCLHNKTLDRVEYEGAAGLTGASQRVGGAQAVVAALTTVAALTLNIGFALT